jgi:hypothetical protein
VPYVPAAERVSNENVYAINERPMMGKVQTNISTQHMILSNTAWLIRGLHLSLGRRRKHNCRRVEKVCQLLEGDFLGRKFFGNG